MQMWKERQAERAAREMQWAMEEGARAAQQRAMADQAICAAMPKVVDSQPHIPRVKRKGE